MGLTSNTDDSSLNLAEAVKLDRRFVEKPWGRSALPAMFGAPCDERIGEIWFLGPADAPLLAKYLFTSERLSVQVHPSDEQARLNGLRRGKNECWYVLDAEPGATIGLGLRRALTKEELRSAALDGSIVDEIDWRPVNAGDFLYVPAGTIHAIGAGISLLEIQQNSDVTYRLYDYGRPRQLHLDEGVAVSSLRSYPWHLMSHVDPQEDVILVDGPHFVLACSGGDALIDRERWVLPLSGSVRCDNESAGPGECLLIAPGRRLESDRARLLIGAAS